MSKWPNEIGTDVFGLTMPSKQLAQLEWTAEEAAANDADAIMTSKAGKTSKQTISSGLENPPCVRTLTVTAGGTAGDIKASKVKIIGTNYADEEISEEFQLTADTAGTIAGVKAFKTVKSVEIPAQDGTGCTFTVGTGSGLGLPVIFDAAPLFIATFDGSADAGAITADDDELEKNIYTSNSSLNAKAVKLLMAL